MYHKATHNKLAVSTLVLLAITTLFSASALALTQQNPTPKEKADGLITLLMSANETVTVLFHRYEANNIRVPQASLNLYSQAMNLAKEIQNLYRTGNYLEANSKTVQALQKLKETLHILFESAILQQTDTEAALEKAILLNSSIRRYHDQLGNIESLLKSAKTANLNTTFLDTKSAVARTLLQNASTYLSQNKLETAEIYITETGKTISQMTTTLNEITNELKTARLETYINQTETRLTALRLQATTISSSLYLTALKQAETSIDLAKTYLQQRLYNQTIAELISAKASEEQATQALKPSANATSTTGSTAELSTSSTTRGSTLQP